MTEYFIEFIKLCQSFGANAALDGLIEEIDLNCSMRWSDCFTSRKLMSYGLGIVRRLLPRIGQGVSITLT